MTTETMTLPLPEEDLIDGLFYKCDSEKNGLVPVSSLIKYLQSTAGQDIQSISAIDNLSVMLDPKGTNSAIDLVTYRKTIYKWIKKVRENDSEISTCDKTVQLTSTKKQGFHGNLFSPNFLKDEDVNMSNTTVESSNLDVSCRHFESEISELTTRVGDLQYQNRKLAEENEKLEQQLESQEESISTVTQETVTLKKKIKSLQELVDLRTVVQLENEELKVSLSKYHERRKELENRLNQVERENTSLQGQIIDYESQVQILSSELEDANGQQKSLQTTLVEQKHLLMKLTEERNMHEAHLSEKTSQIQELQTCLQDLNKMNEELKHDHSDLQIQFIQAQQKVTKLQSKEDAPELGEENCDEVYEEARENLGNTPPSSSIHNEIKQILGDAHHLPSPLSDKELHESFLSRSPSGESWTTEELLELQTDTAVVAAAGGEGDGVKTLDSAKLICKFQEQQDSFRNQVNEILTAVQTTSDTNYNEEDNKENNDNSAEQTKEQKDSGNQWEIRCKRLTLVLQKLKGENERLLRIHDEAVTSLANWESSLDCSVDNRLTVLRDVLLEERALKKQYLREVELLKRKLDESKHMITESDGRTKAFKEELTEVEEKVAQLRKTNLDLAEKCHKSELKLADIQEDINHSTWNLEREKYRNNELEDSLANTTLARQLDLRDIWRLVQKDVETECMEDQNESAVSDSTDQLKEQISKEIESLKDSLIKRKAALGALKGKPMKLSLDSEGNYCEHMDTSPSSPLVDALTIDFFNGNYPVTKPGNKLTGTMSSNHSSFDSCYACKKNTSGHTNHALSCPSLQLRHCQRDSGYDQGHYLYSNLNTSSSSSTSGIDVSPRCSRSVDGQNRRRDFIRSSIKYSSGSQTSAESNTNSEPSYPRQQRYTRKMGERVNRTENIYTNVQSPSAFRRPSFTNAIENRKDANDNISPFSRNRSLSFQAAIERGRKSPVEEIDFISTSCDSTPERLHYPQYVQQEIFAASKSESKSVSFDLLTEEFYDTSSEAMSPDEGSTIHQERGEDTQKDTAFQTQVSRQQQTQQQQQLPSTLRKLSTLVEEDTDQTDSHSDRTVTPQLIKSIVDEYATPPRPSEKRNIETGFQDQSERKRKNATAKVATDITNLDRAAKNSNEDESDEDPSKIQEERMDIPAPEESKVEGIKIPARKSQTKDDTLVVPGSPDNKMIEDPSVSPKLSPRVKPESRLAKLRQNNLAKKREQMRTMKLPELREHTEADMGIPQLVTVSENTLTPPSPTQDMVTPSLPDEFLDRLGLRASPEGDSVNIEDLPEDEVERKFCSLALAIKTDRMTLDKRKGIHERSRNLAEENVEMELNGLKDSAEELNHSVADAKMRDVLHRIQAHIEVIEQSTVKVSSTAEVFGAVQQEKRMSLAMEVMITYVNHLKAMYDKDHTELVEARKQLDRPLGSQSFLDLDRTNRSMSVAALKLLHQRSRSPSPAAGATKEKTRRRSEVALPRMCGGIGAPLLRHSASLDYPLFTEYKQLGSTRDLLAEEEDPKQRFQAVVGNTQMRNSVASTFRRGSLERQASSQSSKSSSGVSLSRESSTEKSKESQDKVPIKQGSQEEEAYHKGFEDGVKAKLGQELSELREKQNHIGQSLEDVMDKVERSKEEDEREKEEAQERRLMQMRALGLQKPSWDNAGRTFRLALAGLIFMMAVGMVIMTILPGSASGMDLHADIHHFGAPPV